VTPLLGGGIPSCTVERVENRAATDDDLAAR